MAAPLCLDGDVAYGRRRVSDYTDDSVSSSRSRKPVDSTSQHRRFRADFPPPPPPPPRPACEADQKSKKESSIGNFFREWLDIPEAGSGEQIDALERIGRGFLGILTFVGGAITTLGLAAIWTGLLFVAWCIACASFLFPQVGIPLAAAVATAPLISGAATLALTIHFLYNAFVGVK